MSFCRVLEPGDPQIGIGGARAGCVYCPPQAAVPGAPANLQITPAYGWDAGAVSGIGRGGDCYTQFQLEQSLGVVVGFSRANAAVTDPTSIDHGLYFCTLGPIQLFQVLERGTPKTAPAERASDDVWRIERWNGEVRYLRNGALVYVSTAHSTGYVRVGARFYASGDVVQ